MLAIEPIEFRRLNSIDLQTGTEHEKQHFAENPLRFDLDRIAVKTTRISVSYRLRLPIRESFPVCAMVGSSGDDQRRNNQDRRDGESDPHASCNGIGGRRSNVARR